MNHKNISIFLFITFSWLVWVISCTADVQDVPPTALDKEFYSRPTGLSPIEHVWNKGVPRTKNFRNVLRDIMSETSKKLLRAAYAEFDLINVNVSSTCLRHVIKTISGIKKMKLWALKMVDASGGIPKGFFSGTLTAYGDFDGCQRVKVSGEFLGRYCLLEMIPQVEMMKKYALPAFVRDESGKDKVLQMALENSYEAQGKVLKGNFLLTVRSGICVPSTCDEHDVNAFITKLTTIVGINNTVTAKYCKSAKDKKEFTAIQIASVAVFAIIFTMVAIGTIYDLFLEFLRKNDEYKEESGIPSRVALCFSMYSNTKKLLASDDRESSISVFHGLKVFASCYVILIHTYSVFFMSFASASLLNVREWLRNLSFMLIVNGNQAIEGFFFISAVLLLYNSKVHGDNQTRGLGGTRIRHTFFVQAARRYWRLMPLVLLLFAFSTLIPHLGNGPEFDKVVNFFMSKCKRTWWTTLIFINNYIDATDICMPWLWYIPVDMHLYLYGVFVLAIIRRFPRSAYWIFGLSATFGLLLVIGNTFYYTVITSPVYLVLLPPENMMTLLNNYFMRTHVHVVPYAVGMAVGYYLRSKPKLRMHWCCNLFLWMSSLIMSVVVLLCVYEWNQGNLPTVLVSAIYNCSVKVVLSLSVGWLTIACCTGHGGFVKKLLSWAPFVPLGRLTYTVYLVHPVIQLMDLATVKFIQIVEHKTIIFKYMAYVTSSYAVAYLCAVCFEYPFAQLARLIFVPKRTKKFSDSTPGELNETNGKLEHHLWKMEENGAVIIKSGKLDVIV